MLRILILMRENSCCSVFGCVVVDCVGDGMCVSTSEVLSSDTDIVELPLSNITSLPTTASTATLLPSFSNYFFLI